MRERERRIDREIKGESEAETQREIERARDFFIQPELCV